MARPNLDNAPPGGGGGGGGGGGTPGGTPSAPIAGLPFGENGGIIATNLLLLIPAIDVNTRAAFFGILDTSSFDDKKDGSSYSYKVEDVFAGRVPTVRRVILTYRDMGLAQATITVSGSNDTNQVISASVLVALGNLIPTFKLLTAYVDVALTCFRPQLTISRAAGDGPISISSAVMLGNVEGGSL